MRAIIMADGKAIRWYANIQKKYWGNISKQLVEVDGEAILHRTVRLLKENNINDIKITSHEPAHEVEGATRAEPDINIDKFAASKPIWNFEEITLFLYGDVFYTDEAMKTIVEFPVDKFLFFGRFGQSALTGHGDEIFAVKISGKEAHKKFLEAALMIYVWKELGYGKNSAWEIYRYLNGARPPEVYIHSRYPNFVDILDFTDDFDTPEIYEHWLEVYNANR
jgi:hypothetical protein